MPKVSRQISSGIARGVSLFEPHKTDRLPNKWLLSFLSTKTFEGEQGVWYRQVEG